MAGFALWVFAFLVFCIARTPVVFVGVVDTAAVDVVELVDDVEAVAVADALVVDVVELVELVDEEEPGDVPVDVVGGVVLVVGGVVLVDGVEVEQRQPFVLGGVGGVIVGGVGADPQPDVQASDGCEATAVAT